MYHHCQWCAAYARQVNPLIQKLFSTSPNQSGVGCDFPMHVYIRFLYWNKHPDYAVHYFIISQFHCQPLTGAFLLRPVILACV
jgi:hypothetical protein